MRACSLHPKPRIPSLRQDTREGETESRIYLHRRDHVGCSLPIYYSLSRPLQAFLGSEIHQSRTPFHLIRLTRAKWKWPEKETPLALIGYTTPSRMGPIKADVSRFFQSTCQPTHVTSQASIPRSSTTSKSLCEFSELREHAQFRHGCPERCRGRDAASIPPPSTQLGCSSIARSSALCLGPE